MKVTKHVGAYIGSSYMNSGIDSFYGPNKFPASATWPFATLVLDNVHMTLTVLSNKTSVKYSDVQKIIVTELGYIQVIGPSDVQSFGFGVLGIRKMLRLLEECGIPKDKIKTQNIVFARATITLVVMCAAVIVFLIVRDVLTR